MIFERGHTKTAYILPFPVKNPVVPTSLSSPGGDLHAAQAPLPLPGGHPRSGLQGDRKRHGLRQALALHQDLELLLHGGNC